MREPIRVAVGVLSAGEPSLQRALTSIEAQTDVRVELIHIADQPKWEAHRQLFARFNDMTADHDLIVKVDADMEVVHPRLFAALGKMFLHCDDVDHIPVMVDDWLSGRRIWGLNSWRGGVTWTDEPPDLLTDRAPNTARRTLPPLDLGIPLVLHASDPSPRQALRYGAHRALKAAVVGNRKSLGRLRNLVEFCITQPKLERRLVLVAVIEALRDPEDARKYVDGRSEVIPIQAALDAATATPLTTLAQEARRAVCGLSQMLDTGDDAGPKMPPEPSPVFAWRVANKWVSAVRFRGSNRPRNPEEIMRDYLGESP